MIAGQGLLVMLAGQLEISTGLPLVRINVAATTELPQPLAADPASFVARRRRRPSARRREQRRSCS